MLHCEILCGILCEIYLGKYDSSRKLLLSFPCAIYIPDNIMEREKAVGATEIELQLYNMANHFEFQTELPI